jgi:hypothetical protein
MHKVSGSSAAVDRSVVQAVAVLTPWLLMAELHPNVPTILIFIIVKQ